jgi:hypothetical protein
VAEISHTLLFHIRPMAAFSASGDRRNSASASSREK